MLCSYGGKEMTPESPYPSEVLYCDSSPNCPIYQLYKGVVEYTLGILESEIDIIAKFKEYECEALNYVAEGVAKNILQATIQEKNVVDLAIKEFLREDLQEKLTKVSKIKNCTKINLLNRLK